MKLSTSSLLPLLLGSLVSCASMTTPQTPDYYPNPKLRNTSASQRDADERECLEMGHEYERQPNKYQQMAKEGLIGGAVGAGTGAVAGAITGNAGRGTGAGAAVGGILGVLHSASKMNENTPTYERFVEECMSERGYKVVGWSSKTGGILG